MPEKKEQFQKFLDSYEKVPVREFPNEVSGQKDISVVVQAYMHEPYIRKCVESILEQDFKGSYEILINEDESADKTREICKELAVAHPDRIRLFLGHRENNIAQGGIPTGRYGRLFSQFNARGKYLAYCNGDDYWTNKTKLQKQFDFLESHPEHVVCWTRFETFYQKKDVPNLGESPFFEGKEQGWIDISVSELLQFFPVQTSSIMFRADLIQFNLQEKYGMDIDINIFVSLLFRGKGAICNGEPCVVYRRHEGGIWGGMEILRRAEFALQTTESLIRQLGPLPVLLKRKKRKYLNLVKACLLNRKYGEAYKALKENKSQTIILKLPQLGKAFLKGIIQTLAR